MHNHRSLKFIFIILLWGILLSNTASYTFAQSDSEVEINVSARVISSIELLTLQSISLTEEEVENDVITIAPVTSGNAGKMVAIGNAGSEIRISYLPSREMTRIGGTEILEFHYSVAGNTEDDQSSAEILDQENRDFEFNGAGRFYLWIGGQVDISTAVPGNYEGDFTLEVEYI